MVTANSLEVVQNHLAQDVFNVSNDLPVFQEVKVFHAVYTGEQLQGFDKGKKNE
jgi:CRISPR/Cas system CMR-associated protein Cmr1 (group 7 of RAMP superfamily)